VTNRWDETWHRLREWTNGQGPSERLAAQILLSEGYKDLDPSHPLGGRDGLKDAVCVKDGKRWVMAAFFPRGQEKLSAIKKKLLDDLKGVATNAVDALAFVTNQELSLSERAALKKAAKGVLVELYHLDRVTTILDQPAMADVRRQFLGIEAADNDVVAAVKGSLSALQKELVAVQTGGGTFCYWMLYHFDLPASIAQQFCIIRSGEHSLYAVHLRIRDMDNDRDVFSRDFGELNAPAIALLLRWPLAESVYYRAFFSARNGSWHQDLVLRRSTSAGCWLAATRIVGGKGEIRLEHRDAQFDGEFAEPEWRG
jgi:hypothetical protein